MIFPKSAIVASLLAAISTSTAVAQYVNCPASTGDFVVLKDVASGSTTINSGGTVSGEGVSTTFNGTSGTVVTTTGEFTEYNPSNTTYWFFKFDTVECADISGYNAISFDMIAPVGSKFEMMFVTQYSNCSKATTCVNSGSCTQGPDSKYLNIENYAKPNGTWQSVSVPFTDFLTNSVGGKTDFYHIKDFTLINFSPLTVGTSWVFNNFVLKAGCTKGIDTPPSDRPGNSTRPAGQDPNFNSTSTATTATSSRSATAGAAGGTASASSTGSANSGVVKSISSSSLIGFAITLFAVMVGTVVASMA